MKLLAVILCLFYIVESKKCPEKCICIMSTLTCFNITRFPLDNYNDKIYFASFHDSILTKNATIFVRSYPSLMLITFKNCLVNCTELEHLNVETLAEICYAKDVINLPKIPVYQIKSSKHSTIYLTLICVLVFICIIGIYICCLS